ncbi:MAG: hypothetical protein R3B46_01835 [Phycisphaerales bacterium]
MYFSAPLDLDFLMLQHFADAYHGTVAGGKGPKIPAEDDEDFAADVEAVVNAVLKEAGGEGDSYNDEERTAFFWYRHLFLSRGKPTTHIKALSELEQATIRTQCPPILKKLVKRMKKELASGIGGAPDAA